MCENKHCTLEECSIPYGFCHCGCGTKTAIAPQNDKYMGRIKGEPYRYIIRHGTRLSGVDFIVDEKTGCWEWQLGKDKDGYGMVTVRGKQLRAHRFYYEQKYGLIPKELVIDHVVCQNPSCVNPDHLEPVTSVENTRRGKNTKLTQEQVNEIRNLDRCAQTELGNKYGVSQSQISRIQTGVRWSAET